MTRTAFLTTLLAFAGGTAASAGTFVPSPILDDPGVDVFNRHVAREMVDRDLFSGPYATAVIGSVDVYDIFPYLEARTFEVVSDPGWNRLLYGEVGGALKEYRGVDAATGALSEPKGLSTDAAGRIYVADAGNHRILVLESRREYGTIDLVARFAIQGLSRPQDVAHSDRGTPFDASDDVLYVADTGANRVVAFDLEGDSAKLRATVGELGSGANHFGGPMAISVGRSDGANTSDVYVADAHSGRVVHLVDQGGALAWASEAPLVGGIATSLDVDHRGNVYAAMPQAGRVVKMTSSLETLASTDSGVDRPRDFHVPFVTRTDHRDGTRRYVGQGAGLVVEEWNDVSGIRLMKLGVEVKDLVVTGDRDVAASFTLTDHAHLVAEVLDEASGVVLARHEIDAAPGAQSIRFASDDPAAPLADGTYVLRVRAASAQSDVSGEAQSSFPLAGAGLLPSRAALLASHPNPFSSTTNVSFAVPAGSPRAVRVGIYDVSGRLVRLLQDGMIAAGVHARPWDGRDTSGQAVSAGVYLTRFEIGGESLTQKVVRMR